MLVVKNGFPMYSPVDDEDDDDADYVDDDNNDDIDDNAYNTQHALV